MRAYVHTGNPVYPFFKTVFGGAGLNEVLDPIKRPLAVTPLNLLFALGPLCGVNDADAVIAASSRCDELGLDTISTGGTIAWAMECVEKGLIDAPWLRFGDADAMLRAIEEIGAANAQNAAGYLQQQYNSYFAQCMASRRSPTPPYAAPGPGYAPAPGYGPAPGYAPQPSYPPPASYPPR